LSLGASATTADVVVVVAAKSPVVTLNNDQVMDIFLGKATRFPDGSQAQPIDQIEDSPARNEFYLKSAGKTAAQLKAFWSKIIFTGRGRPPREVPGSAELKKYIVANPGAIGYMERDQVDASLKIVAPTR
jgi:ABC-type phosphate transport system substrate-binding protein